MCTHDFYIFSTCGHVFLSPQPVVDCPYKRIRDKMQAQALNSQFQAVRAGSQAQAKPRHPSLANTEVADKTTSSTKPLPEVPVNGDSHTVTVNSPTLTVAIPLPRGYRPARGQTGALVPLSAAPCEKASQHPYRSHLIHRLCRQCTIQRQGRLRTIAHSGLMEGVLFEEARWRVRLEGKRQDARKQSRPGQSPVSPSVMGNQAGEGGALTRQRSLEEFKLPIRVAGMHEGRGIVEVDVNGAK